MRRVWLYLFVIVVLLLIAPFLIVVPVSLVWTLATGWAVSGARLLARIAEQNLPLGGFAIATVFLILASHAFLCSFGKAKVWPIHYTAALFAAIALVLFSCMGLIGVAHQTGWLLTSGEPWVVSRSKWIQTRAHAVALASAVKRAGENVHWRSGELFFSLAGEPAVRGFLDHFQLLPFVTEAGSIKWILILPRETEKESKFVALALIPESASESFASKVEVQHWLNKHDPGGSWMRIPVLN